MDHIDVRDIPDPVAKALASVVEILRRELSTPREGPRPADSNGQANVGERLAKYARPGKVFGTLTREELYDDVA